jgi:6-phosphogluconolactonase
MARWHVYPGQEQLIDRAAAAIRGGAEQALAARGEFHIVLAGGNTPRGIYERLSATGTGDERWQVWFGDERYLPAGHADRNETMARDTWLVASGIPEGNIHPMGDGPTPEAAAAAYAALVAPIKQFDLVLLGVGEDGHTASLFPGHDVGEGPEAPDVLVVTDAPKPPPVRITLSAHRLSRARQVLFMVTGESKQTAVSHWRHGLSVPAARVSPPTGVDVFLDERAAPGF